MNGNRAYIVKQPDDIGVLQELRYDVQTAVEGMSRPGPPRLSSLYTISIKRTTKVLAACTPYNCLFTLYTIHLDGILKYWPCALHATADPVMLKSHGVREFVLLTGLCL